MKRRGFKLSLMMVAILLLAVAALVHFKKSSNRAVLERYKAELLAKGEVLSLARLAGLPSTNEAEVASRQVISTQNIALRAGTFDLPEYIAPGKVGLAWGGGLRLSAWPAGNTRPNWEEFAVFNAGSAVALDQARQALETPPPDVGFVWMDDFDNNLAWKGNFVHDRILAQSLQNEIMQNLHTTNLGAAVADLHALAQQVRMNRNEATLVSQMVRIAIAGVGLNDTWQALQAPGWDDAKLAALQKDWEGLDLLAAIERGFESERASSQLIMAKFRKSSTRDFIQLMKNWTGTVSQPQTTPKSQLASVTSGLEMLAYELMGMNEDELFQLQEGSKALGAVGDLQKGRPWREVDDILTKVAAEVAAAIGGNRSYRYLISAVSLPNFEKAAKTSVRIETLRRLTVAEIAIKRYQLKHAAPPPSLEALVPEFMQSVPIDPMSGKELRYRLNADGTFVLYSAGEDGVDDGGDPTPRTPGDKPDMWSGKDAVWLMAATEEEQAAAEANTTKAAESTSRR